MDPVTPKPAMSLRAYARRRGVSPMSVSDAARDGRLVKSILRDPLTGRVAGITDPDLADQEWAENTDATKVSYAARERKLAATSGEAPAALNGEPISAIAAAARSKHWEAELRQLKYETAVGKLVSKAEVLREWSSVLAVVRTKMLALPTALKQEIPTLTVEDVVKIEAKVREALEDLVESEAAS